MTSGPTGDKVGLDVSGTLGVRHEDALRELDD
jgi:hypothetical protein